MFINYYLPKFKSPAHETTNMLSSLQLVPSMSLAVEMTSNKSLPTAQVEPKSKQIQYKTKRKTCETCRRCHRKCDGNQPCSNCKMKGYNCIVITDLIDVECIYCTRKPYTRRKPRVIQKRKTETSLVPKDSEPESKKVKTLEVPHGTNTSLYLNSIVIRFLEIHKHYLYPYHPLNLPDSVR
jgi:hypothetical protein